MTTKEARAAYMREWRKKNPERAKAINDAFWERKAEQMSVAKAAEQDTAKDGEADE